MGRTASGIGLGIPATMELAIREAGEARILGATAAAAVTKPFGVKGVFYRVAGPAVRAIDGPTRGTIPPYDGHAKMGPEDPEGVARDLATALGVGVAIIDANDIGVNVLGVSSGVDPDAGRVAPARQPARSGRPADPRRPPPPGLTSSQLRP